MIEYNLDTEHSILLVQPKSAIEQDDFVKLAKAVEPRQRLGNGLIPLGSSVLVSHGCGRCAVPQA